MTSNGDGLNKAEGVKMSKCQRRHSQGHLKVIQCYNNVKQGWGGLYEAERVEMSQHWRNKAFTRSFESCSMPHQCQTGMQWVK